MKVDMQLLKQLRDSTFAPLKDCKEALVESNGDLDAAMELLRKKWISKAWKKADRETNEWLVKVVQKDQKIAAVKLLCETDFVAKNEAFLSLLDTILEKLLDSWENFDSIESAPADLVASLTELTNEFVGKIWENTKIGDIIVSSQNAYVYNHPGNKVAAIVYYSGDNEDIVKELALQVAAMNPTYLDFESVDQDAISNMKVEFSEALVKEWKPAEMIEKIVEWKIRKSFADDVLLEQEYIRDGSKKIKDILPEDLVINSFVRLSIS